MLDDVYSVLYCYKHNFSAYSIFKKPSQAYNEDSL